MSERKLSRKNTLKKYDVRQAHGILLHFLAYEDFSLTAALCSVIKDASITQTIESLLKIMHSVGRSYELLQWSISREIRNNAARMANMFRGRSPATLLLNPFYREEGSEYLNRVLVRCVADVYEKEFDPDSDESLADILSLTQRLVDTITQSASFCPIPLRLIFKKAKNETQQFNPTFSEIVVGMFIILRFLCPALVTPDVTGLHVQPPSAGVRKGLVLISKILQWLANKTQPGENEPHYARLRLFCQENQDKMLQFFGELIDISPIDEKEYVNIMYQRRFNLQSNNTDSLIQTLDSELSFLMNIFIANTDQITTYLSKHPTSGESLQNFKDFFELIKPSTRRKSLFRVKSEMSSLRKLSMPASSSTNPFRQTRTKSTLDIFGTYGYPGENSDSTENFLRRGDQIKEELMTKISDLESFWRSFANAEMKKSQMLKSEVDSLKDQIRKQHNSNSAVDNEKDSLRKKLDSVVISKLVLEERSKGLEQEINQYKQHLKKETEKRKGFQNENRLLHRKIRHLKRDIKKSKVEEGKLQYDDIYDSSYEEETSSDSHSSNQEDNSDEIDIFDFLKSPPTN